MKHRDPLHIDDLALFDTLWQRVMGPAGACHCQQPEAGCGCAWRCVDEHRPIVGLLTAWQGEAVQAAASPAQASRLLSAFLAAQLWLTDVASRHTAHAQLLWHREPGQPRLIAVHRELLLQAVGPQAGADAATGTREVREPRDARRPAAAGIDG